METLRGPVNYVNGIVLERDSQLYKRQKAHSVAVEKANA